MNQMQRIYNFNPGPAALPLEVLQQAQQEFVTYGEHGMSLMEMSHRSKAVEQLVEETLYFIGEFFGESVLGSASCRHCGRIGQQQGA